MEEIFKYFMKYFDTMLKIFFNFKPDFKSSFFSLQFL